MTLLTDKCTESS